MSRPRRAATHSAGRLTGDRYKVHHLRAGALTAACAATDDRAGRPAVAMSNRPTSLLRIAPFRAVTLATVVNAVGMMGETVVLGWLTLELTGSPFWVGVAMGARALPFLLVGVPAGALADRLPRGRLLVATGAGQALVAAALGALALLGAASLWLVVGLTFLNGAIRAVEQAARQSYAHDVVGPAGLVDGLAILGAATRAGWLVGSLAAGWAIATTGAGGAYLGVACGYLAGALALIPAAGPPPGSAVAHASLWQSVVEFARAVRADSVLLGLMLLTAGAEVLGFSHQVLLPSLARDVLRVGPEGLGALNAARSIGGIAGLAIVWARRRGADGGGALFLAVLVVFGVALVALGLAPSAVGFGGVFVLLVAVNAAGAVTDLLAQSLMQLSAPPHLRGRAGGAWVVAIGLAPLGQLQVGALASAFGVGAALASSGAGLVALAAAAALVFPRLWRL